MTEIDTSKYVSPMAGFLTNPVAYREQRFAEAKGLVKEGMELHVSATGCWSGSFPAHLGRSVESFERIGYHSGAEWFLEGFLAAGGRVVFHGFDGIHGQVVGR